MSSSVPSSKPSSKGSSWGKPHRVGPEKVAKGEGSPEHPRRKGAAKYQSENQHAAQGRGGETAKVAAADEWEASGTAFRLLQPAKAEEKEYGEWAQSMGAVWGR
jgi:hypothetical protein